MAASNVMFSFFAERNSENVCGKLNEQLLRPAVFVVLGQVHWVKRSRFISLLLIYFKAKNPGPQRLKPKAASTQLNLYRFCTRWCFFPAANYLEI